MSLAGLMLATLGAACTNAPAPPMLSWNDAGSTYVPAAAATVPAARVIEPFDWYPDTEAQLREPAPPPRPARRRYHNPDDRYVYRGGRDPKTGRAFLRE